jgi:hypothetical protein
LEEAAGVGVEQGEGEAVEARVVGTGVPLPEAHWVGDTLRVGL